MSTRSGWETWTDSAGTRPLQADLEFDAKSWDRERLAMLEDAAFLIEAAFCGETSGPLAPSADKAAQSERPE